jgi:hypothetical protein
MAASRMPRYHVMNDGMGPYAVFYCDKCSREYRSQADVTGAIKQDVGNRAMRGFLRGIPLVGGIAADAIIGEDARYSVTMSESQLKSAWGQVADRFYECPTCVQTVCVSCWDAVSGYCNDDSPRKANIAEAQGEQGGAMLKGFASAFGLGAALEGAMQATKQVANATSATMARCPSDGTLAAAGTKFCPECGTPMTQPAAALCPKCGTDAKGAKFCPECGTRIEAAPTNCPNCGTDAKGAKFCPECGTKIA